MRIVVREDGKTHFHLSLPTGLALNRLTAAMMPRILRENGIEITYDQAMAFFTAVKRYKKIHPEWNLVEVESADGAYVLVRL